LSRGRGDPANQYDGATGTFWRCCATPAGDATVAIRLEAGAKDRGEGGDTVCARAWGPGAAWVLQGLPRLLGGEQPTPELDLRSQPRLAEAARRHPGLRQPATGLVLDQLVPAILEQRVTGMQAHRAWRGLVRRYGRPAPGPNRDLRVPPDAATLLEVPVWQWRGLDVDISRQRAVRAAASVARRLEECVDMPAEQAIARLTSVPGIGQWTAAEVAQRSFGYEDAVSVGDFHLPSTVVHFFTGRARGTDEEMLELLEPWRGHRQRVVRLVLLTGVHKPKFGPRYSPFNVRDL
jgi:3-methyladenine DNA glycosylase/8-oxoguanine DNA glycosylase